MVEHTFLQPLLILALAMAMLWLHVLGCLSRCVYLVCPPRLVSTWSWLSIWNQVFIYPLCIVGIVTPFPFSLFRISSLYSSTRLVYMEPDA